MIMEVTGIVLPLSANYWLAGPLREYCVIGHTCTVEPFTIDALSAFAIYPLINSGVCVWIEFLHDVFVSFNHYL